VMNLKECKRSSASIYCSIIFFFNEGIEENMNMLRIFGLQARI
jgi:hypothetical protein